MINLKDIDLHSIGNTIQIVGVVYAGEGRVLVIPFHGEDVDLQSAEILHMSISEWEAFLRQTDAMETEILCRAEDGTITKAIVRKCERQIDQNISWRVYRRDGFRCRYCAANDIPLTVDHLVRWEVGGPTIEANLVACCKKCNRTRGNMMYGDWLRHPRYVQAAQRLTPEERALNEALLPTLARIPTRMHVRDRK